jgi:hypothetical protein
LKTIANIATHPGREEQLALTLISIREQFDEINIYDNGKEQRDLTDRGKFYFLQKYTEPVYYFTLDDDIIYPPDYVRRTIAHIEAHGAIITYHGRRLTGRGLNYYKQHDKYHFIRAQSEAIELDVPGTGVMAFRTDYFNPVKMYRQKIDKMVDLVFAVSAAEADRMIILPPKTYGWLLPQFIPKHKTIYGMFEQSCEQQNELADLVICLRGR